MILAVTGGKGGVGKSTVAYNLAAELSGVVVDADLAMADLPTSRGPDLHDVLAGRADAVEAVREGGPVDLLPCGRTLSGARAAAPRNLPEALDAVERAYGRVVVDCPAGLRADAGLPLVAADAALLVTTPTATALSDAVRARALARRFDAGLVRVALNRAGPDPPVDGVADLLGAPAVPIPESDPLARTLTVGRPLRDLAPDARARERIVDLADAAQSVRS